MTVIIELRLWWWGRDWIELWIPQETEDLSPKSRGGRRGKLLGGHTEGSGFFLYWPDRILIKCKAKYLDVTAGGEEFDQTSMVGVF